MAPVIAPLPADAVAPVSEEASAFEQVLARHHQITKSLAMVRKLFETSQTRSPIPTYPGLRTPLVHPRTIGHARSLSADSCGRPPASTRRL